MCVSIELAESQNRPNEEVRVGTIGTQRHHVRRQSPRIITRIAHSGLTEQRTVLFSGSLICNGFRPIEPFHSFPIRGAAALER